MVVQPTPPLPPTTATDLPRVDLVETVRETRCSAASRSLHHHRLGQPLGDAQVHRLEHAGRVERAGDDDHAGVGDTAASGSPDRAAARRCRGCRRRRRRGPASRDVQAGHVGDRGVVDPEAPRRNEASRSRSYESSRVMASDTAHLTRSVLTTKALPATPGSMVEDGDAGYGMSRPTISVTLTSSTNRPTTRVTLTWNGRPAGSSKCPRSSRCPDPPPARRSAADSPSTHHWPCSRRRCRRGRRWRRRPSPLRGRRPQVGEGQRKLIDAQRVDEAAGLRGDDVSRRHHLGAAIADVPGKALDAARRVAGAIEFAWEVPVRAVGGRGLTGAPGAAPRRSASDRSKPEPLLPGVTGS